MARSYWSWSPLRFSTDDLVRVKGEGRDRWALRTVTFTMGSQVSGRESHCTWTMIVVAHTHLLKKYRGSNGFGPWDASSSKDVKSLSSPHMMVATVPSHLSLRTRFLILTLVSPRVSKRDESHPWSRFPSDESPFSPSIPSLSPPRSLSLGASLASPSRSPGATSPPPRRSSPVVEALPPLSSLGPASSFTSRTTSTVSKQISIAFVDRAVHGMLTESSLAKALSTVTRGLAPSSPCSPDVDRPMALRSRSRLWRTTLPFVSLTLRSSFCFCLSSPGAPPPLSPPSVVRMNFFSSLETTAVSTVSMATRMCPYRIASVSSILSVTIAIALSVPFASLCDRNRSDLREDRIDRSCSQPHRI